MSHLKVLIFLCLVALTVGAEKPKDGLVENKNDLKAESTFGLGFGFAYPYLANYGGLGFAGYGGGYGGYGGFGVPIYNYGYGVGRGFGGHYGGYYG